MSKLEESRAYQAALEEAGFVEGDRIGVSYRAVPAIPMQGNDGKPYLARMRTGTTLVKFHDGFITCRLDNGTTTVDPLSELLVEKPSSVAVVQSGPRIVSP